MRMIRLRHRESYFSEIKGSSLFLGLSSIFADVHRLQLRVNANFIYRRWRTTRFDMLLYFSTRDIRRINARSDSLAEAEFSQLRVSRSSLCRWFCNSTCPTWPHCGVYSTSAYRLTGKVCVASKLAKWPRVAGRSRGSKPKLFRTISKGNPIRVVNCSCVRRKKKRL